MSEAQQEYSLPAAGKLKIFFGYAAGVGKTYAMLEAAHQAKQEGIDVVVGYVEPHARPDTLALLNGLEAIPCREINYRGIRLKEFDLDAALRRKPQLILVDELAHSNAQGSRHTKRYQDVEELLKAGINVYTTVNVQHLESLNNLVSSITGIAVNERIPDHVFDRANQVELVDIEPDELVKRLQTGKVYRERQAKRALENFFTQENLAALREIAMRRTADQLNRAAVQEGKEKSARAGEHVLVCLSSSPSNAKVIRAAARMAGVEPATQPIRGGTDGARLSFMGLPCPNLGTGGYNFHGPYECVTAEGMDTVVRILRNIISLYAQTKA